LLATPDADAFFLAGSAAAIGSVVSSVLAFRQGKAAARAERESDVERRVRIIETWVAYMRGLQHEHGEGRGGDEHHEG
jgi:hypothetical protein